MVNIECYESFIVAGEIVPLIPFPPRSDLKSRVLFLSFWLLFMPFLLTTSVGPLWEVKNLVVSSVGDDGLLSNVENYTGRIRFFTKREKG